MDDTEVKMSEEERAAFLLGERASALYSCRGSLVARAKEAAAAEEAHRLAEARLIEAEAAYKAALKAVRDAR